MYSLSEIIKKRSAPGILIFDLGERLLYSNTEVLELIPGLQQTGKAVEEKEQPVLKEIHNICRRVKEALDGKCAAPEGELHYPVLQGGQGHPLLLRAFPIGDHGGEGRPTHIMVLVERITGKRKVDLEKAKETFSLTSREAEVLGLICEGLTNKGISDRMFISEYTVKDHIKKIMKKMGVGTRSEVVAELQ